jgi:hypothetical protein
MDILDHIVTANQGASVVDKITYLTCVRKVNTYQLSAPFAERDIHRITKDAEFISNFKDQEPLTLQINATLSPQPLSHQPTPILINQTTSSKIHHHFKIHYHLMIYQQLKT